MKIIYIDGMTEFVEMVEVSTDGQNFIIDEERLVPIVNVLRIMAV